MPIKFKTVTVLSNHFSEVKIIIITLIISVILAVFVFVNDFMNLSSTIAAVQNKLIFILKVKEICNK